MKKFLSLTCVMISAWILWERVISPGSQEGWRHMGAFQSEADCLSGAPNVAEQGLQWWAYNRPSTLPERISSNPPGFRLTGVKGSPTHMFQCYPSDFDPRPRN